MIVADHLFICNQSASYGDFSIATRENKFFFTRIERGPVNNER